MAHKDIQFLKRSLFFFEALMVRRELTFSLKTSIHKHPEMYW